MALNPEEISRMTSLYATSKSNRESVVRTLLTTDNVFDIEEIPSTTSGNSNRKILDIYLKGMGLEIEG